MKNENYNEMSNSELKLLIESLNNEYENKKAKLKIICEEMSNIEKKYVDVTHELKIRKNIYL